MATKVAVIMGGASFERNFSLKSGALVSEALEKRGYEVLPLDADAHLVDTRETRCCVCVSSRCGRRRRRSTCTFGVPQDSVCGFKACIL